MLIRKDDLDEYTDQGTTVRARQEWDINGEGPGKILLKCEERLGQHKYMSCIVEKNLEGEIISTIKGQQQVQGKMADYWADIFADEKLTTTVTDIEQCIGEEANNNARKLSEEEGREMEEQNYTRGTRYGS